MVEKKSSSTTFPVAADVIVVRMVVIVKPMPADSSKPTFTLNRYRPSPS